MRNTEIKMKIKWWTNETFKLTEMLTWNFGQWDSTIRQIWQRLEKRVLYIHLPCFSETPTCSFSIQMPQWIIRTWIELRQEKQTDITYFSSQEIIIWSPLNHIKRQDLFRDQDVCSSALSALALRTQYDHLNYSNSYYQSLVAREKYLKRPTLPLTQDAKISTWATLASSSQVTRRILKCTAHAIHYKVEADSILRLIQSEFTQRIQNISTTAP
jgi:hypothetical protein